jgi:hypothetical protein
MEKFPGFKSLFKEKDDKKLALLIKNKYPQEYRLLKKHAKEFGWLTFYYIGPPMSVSDLLKAIRNDISSKESLQSQLKKLRNISANCHKENKPLLKNSIYQIILFIC